MRQVARLDYTKGLVIIGRGAVSFGRALHCTALQRAILSPRGARGALRLRVRGQAARAGTYAAEERGDWRAVIGARRQLAPRHDTTRVLHCAQHTCLPACLRLRAPARRDPRPRAYNYIMLLASRQAKIEGIQNNADPLKDEVCLFDDRAKTTY